MPIEGFPKPEPRRRVKARVREAQATKRRACVLAVWERAKWRCEKCGRFLKQSSVWWFEIGHVHEVVPRSRGGDPTDPANCALLCPLCHKQAHERSDQTR